MNIKKMLLACSASAMIGTMAQAQQFSGNNNTFDPISRTGKVGIGTSTPVGLLEVSGDVITQVESGSVGPFTLGSRWNSVGDRVNNPPTGAKFTGFRTQWDFNAVNIGLRERITGGTRDAVISWQDGSASQSNGNRLIFAYRNNQVPTVANPNEGFFERMTLLSGGQLGLGTATPTQRISISTGAQNDGINITQTGTTGAQIFMQNTPSGRSWGIYTAGSANTNLGIAGNFALFNNSTFNPAMVINTNTDFVGINTATPTERLTVNGNIRCVTLFQSSDARMKRNVEKLTNSLDMLRSINAYSYYFKNDMYKKATVDSVGKKEQYDFPAGRQYGVLAQELVKVMPDAVKLNEDGYYAVNYTALIPVLIESVKEQQQQIEDLKTMLATALVQKNLSNPKANTTVPGSIVSVTPNPSSGVINLTYELTSTANSCSIIVYSANGTILSTVAVSKFSGTNRQVININSLSAGSYYIGILINGNLVDSKLVNKS
jgi:hypothetical protein